MKRDANHRNIYRLGAGLLLASSLVFAPSCAERPAPTADGSKEPEPSASAQATAPATSEAQQGSAVRLTSGRDPAPTAAEQARSKQDPKRTRRERISLQVAERTLTAPAPTGMIVIEGLNGPVSVVGADRQDVFIRAEIGATTAERLSQTALRADPQPDGSLRIYAAFPEGSQKGEAMLPVVEVPRTGPAGVMVRTTNGAISLRDAPGDADAEVTSGGGAGGVTVVGQEGRVRAATINSRVEVERAGGTVEAFTENAAITVLDAAAGVMAQTTNAAIRVRFAARRAPSPFTLSTTVGMVALEISGSMAGRIAVEPSYAPIEVDASIPSTQAREGMSPTMLTLRSDAGYLGLIKTPGGSVSVKPVAPDQVAPK